MNTNFYSLSMLKKNQTIFKPYSCQSQRAQQLNLKPNEMFGKSLMHITLV